MTSLSYLLEKLNSDNMSEYLRASEELFKIGQSAVTTLGEIMLNDQGRRGWRAARLLADVADPISVPAFIRALRSANPLIRQAAAQALGNQGTQEAVPHLLDRLYDDDCIMQIWVIEALGELGAVGAINPLLSLLEQTDSAAVQYGIIKALGRIGDVSVVAVLPRFFNSPDHYVRSRSREVYEQLTGTTLED